MFLFREAFFLSESRKYLMYALPMIFVFPMTSLMDGIYRGLKRFKRLSILTILNSVVGIGASYILVTSFGLLGAVLSPLVFFTSYLLLLILFHGEYQFKIEKKILRDIVTYAFFFGVAAIGHYLFSKVNILILGQYNLMEEIAVYELITKFNTEFLLPFVVLGAVIAPNVVGIFSKKDYSQLRGLFRKLLFLTIILGAIFVPLSIFLSRALIGIIFPLYLGEILDTLLLPVVLTNAVVVPVVVINTGMITSTGHAKLMAIQNIVAGIVNVVLNILIIGRYGYVGVVWVTFAVQLVSTIVLYLVYYSKLKRLGE
jgi:O-antigen/teichoic acid export membrane protein